MQKVTLEKNILPPLLLEIELETSDHDFGAVPTELSKHENQDPTPVVQQVKQVNIGA